MEKEKPIMANMTKKQQEDFVKDHVVFVRQVKGSKEQFIDALEKRSGVSRHMVDVDTTKGELRH